MKGRPPLPPRPPPLPPSLPPLSPGNDQERFLYPPTCRKASTNAHRTIRMTFGCTRPLFRRGFRTQDRARNWEGGKDGGREGRREGWSVRLMAVNHHSPSLHTHVYTYLGETTYHRLVLQLLRVHPLLVLRTIPPHVGIAVKITKSPPALSTLHLRLLRVSQNRRLTPRADPPIFMFFLKLKSLILGPCFRPDQRLDIPVLNSSRAGRRDDDWRPPPPSLPRPPPRFLAIETGGLDLALTNLALQVRGETTPAEPMPTPREPERLAHTLILPTNRAKHQLLPQMGLHNVYRQLKRLGHMPRDLS